MEPVSIQSTPTKISTLNSNPEYQEKMNSVRNGIKEAELLINKKKKKNN